ncbi:MAG: ORF6N domain-containing protein [Acidobacteria bacterium]|nr:ORF6N domain-containing protein [Acidobacteriota bacterium]
MEERESILKLPVAERIIEVRGVPVLLDSDLAAIYGVETKALNQAVKRNRDRFPVDFSFILSVAEFRGLRSHPVTSKPGRGGRRNAPRVFTEHGASMARYSRSL